MNLDAANEFDQMISEIATDEHGLPERAVLPYKRLEFLERSHVPETLAGELEELKAMGARAKDMDEEEARNFISRILSFRAKLDSN